MITSKIIRFLSTAALVVGFSTVVHAQATRTWVSGVGDDANPCSRTAPCKTFAGAVSKTATCGEISVLDPGGFGAVTITKALTINGTGTLAGILASLVNGVIVNAPVGDTVILRDISINGACNGLNGIRYLAGKTLMVEHCWIYGMAQNGIDVALTNNGILKLLDTVIEHNGLDGVHITTTVGEAGLAMDRCRIMNSGGDGIEAINNVRGGFSNSVLSYNANGIRTTGTNSVLNMDDMFISFSAVGLQGSAGSTINLSDSIIAQNATGLALGGGTINSFQGNSLINNPVPGAFSGPATPKQ
jgi:hypothetical protein